MSTADEIIRCEGECYWSELYSVFERLHVDA